jgi:hypothetical protein
MKRSILLIHFIIVTLVTISGQGTKHDSLIKDISFYADVMVNADHDAHRLRAQDQFMQLIYTFMEDPESFQISLDSIPWLSVLHGDGFRMITWQMRLNSEEYKYGGFIQWPDKVVELKDTRPWVNGSLRNTYSPGSWYGALYYKLLPVESGKNTYYLLFGFNAENSLVNTKVADILDLSSGEPKFGMPVFLGKEDPQTRIILTYADASSVQLFYDPELKAIVHDHLENLPGVGPSGEVLAVSDGSQEGWFLKNGKWTYQERVYDVKSETPPMTDDRKERKEDKDLFGRPRKE